MTLLKTKLKEVKLKLTSPEKMLIAAGFLFFILYSLFAIRSGTIFNSPDENANYFFSRLVAENNSLKYQLPVTTDVVHPRSMTVVNHKIVPQSFLGLPLIYGLLAKIFSSQAIIFFTPLLSVISVYFFYQIIKKIFNQQTALISSLLFFIHPAVIYYATRGLFHNLLFIDLLIIGLYFLLNKELTNKNIFLSSFFIGLALITRYVEAVWVLSLLLILYLLNRAKISFKQLIIFVTVLTLFFLIIGLLNNNLYGNFFATGYKPSGFSDNQQLPNSAITNFPLEQKSKVILVLTNFWHYGIKIFWWFALPLIIGLTWFCKSFPVKNKNQIYYFLLFLIISAGLILAYGQFAFTDTPDKTKINIGSSYIRYWLPIYIWSLPFITIGLLKIKQLVVTDKYFKSIGTILSLIILIYNFLFVFKLADEALAKNTLLEYQEIKARVLSLTETDSIIVSNYYDKLFFPDRLVITNFEEEREKKLAAIEQLLKTNHEVYYYSWQPNRDIDYLNNKIFNQHNLQLINGLIIAPNERLFKIKLIRSNGQFIF